MSPQNCCLVVVAHILGLHLECTPLSWSLPKILVNNIMKVLGSPPTYMNRRCG